MDSADWTNKILGPGVCGGLDKPLAGGSSLKSTYSQLRALSTSFFGSGGIPLPREMSAEDFPNRDRAEASDSWAEDASRGFDELEVSEAPAAVNVAVSAGSEPASEYEGEKNGTI